MLMTDYERGDWVRYNGVACRVLGHWHDKSWTDYLILGMPDGIEIRDGKRHVTRWAFTGHKLPSEVELIKRRPKEHAEVTEG